MKVSQGVIAGNIISRPDPVYPPIAKAAHVQGVVILHAIISKGGTIEGAQAIAAHESPRTTKLYDRTSDDITLDDHAYTVIGVMPRSFENVLQPTAQLWAPLQYNPALPPERVGEVAIAATTQIGDQGLTIGRSAAILAGLPVTVPGYAIDRMCAGAMTAVTTTAGEVALGAADATV